MKSEAIRETASYSSGCALSVKGSSVCLLDLSIKDCAFWPINLTGRIIEIATVTLSDRLRKRGITNNGIGAMNRGIRTTDRA